MFLFHGTRAKNLPDILAEGLILLARTLRRMAHDMRKTYRGQPIVRHLQEYSK